MQIPTMLRVSGESARVWTTDVGFQGDGGASHAVKVDADSASLLLRRAPPHCL